MDHHNRFQTETQVEIQAERRDSESILETILRGLAAIKNVPITDLDPLYEQINPDALITFHRHAKEADTPISIEFTVDEYAVTVSQTDNVCISDRTST
ncbi:HalOD1 output domain-containing protein [Natronorubrum thiooxidans]|uniref:Halobacterial output domain-containing protein n=1 Tax=Natronorubrum thiooxidans TaxID=308853 RepID=A0A1N7H539_9EURY|nr:HalOD1 output domain-containing protein [Natronorubrum thiooxidans]SIS19965.1 hypothetical protein SAMN05421752_12530 [Natronorubrum thiooxidans]